MTVTNEKVFAMLPGDEIFATAVQFGQTVFNAAFSGVASLGQLILKIQQALGAVSGLVTIMLRNRTQGTSTRRVIRMGATPVRSAVPQGTQLQLAF